MRPGAWVALAAGLGAGLGCHPSRAPATLRFAVRADITGIFPNPPTNNEAYTLLINRNIFEGLVGFDSHLRLVPALAARWENPDEQSYLFELRQGLEFSDGSPVTAPDVAASLLAARRDRWVTRDYLQAIASAEALDDRHVLIRTRSPYFVLLFKLPFGFVLPADAVSQHPVPTVGTGPYRLQSWEPGHILILERNPHYRGAPAPFARAEFRVEPDAGRRVERVRSGEADVANDVPLEDVDRLERDPRLKIVMRPTLRVLYLSLRMDRTPFRDIRVRRAVDLALDRRELVRNALAGRTEVATQIIPAAVVGYNPHLRPAAPDRGRARALLAEAGYPDGLDVRLDGPSNRYVNDRKILREVARQLGRVGIRVQVQALDKVAFFDLIDRGDSAFHLVGWACESGEAGDALDTLAHSPVRGSLGSFNTSGLRDAELDRLIDEANASRSAEERAGRLQAAVARLAELEVMLPLVVQTEAIALSPRIEWDPPADLGFDLRTFRPVS